jgi:hypothetical protein
MTPALKSLVLCSCFYVSSIMAAAQGTTCAADGDAAQGSAIGCVTGEGVVVKGGAETTPQTADDLPLTPEQRPAVPPTVIFERGKLTIVANNANLGEILRIVGEKTGAAIDVPEAADERVVSQLGPGAARDVIAALLNGSHFNYVLVGNEADPNAVDRVVLTAKGDHADSGSKSPADSTIAGGRTRPMPQPRNALLQAISQPSQEMVQQPAAQPVSVPDIQPPPPQPIAAEEPTTPKEPASASGEAGTPPSGGPSGTETASVDPNSSGDGSQKNATGERTPQQMMQDLYETRRQMMQQQQKTSQQAPPQ